MRERKPKTEAKRLKKKEKKISSMAIALTLLLTGFTRVRDNYFHYCPSCGEAFCHDFKGGDMFCYDCFYHSCLKNQGTAMVCQACGGVRHLIRR
jgi:hypothetical protein